LTDQSPNAKDYIAFLLLVYLCKATISGKGCGIKCGTIGSRNSFRSPWELGKHTRSVFRDILGNRVETQKFRKHLQMMAPTQYPIHSKILKTRIIDSQ
jgi:hypothetical protein